MKPASGDLEEMEVVIVPFAEAIASSWNGEIVQLSTVAAIVVAALGTE